MNYLPYRDGESKTEPMNPLEQHLFQVIFGYPSRYEEDNKLQNAIEDKRRATVKEAASIALKWIEDFRDWYDKLSPSDKCTVWPPAGSDCGTGLYNMSTTDLVEKFISHKSKVSNTKENP